MGAVIAIVVAVLVAIAVFVAVKLSKKGPAASAVPQAAPAVAPAAAPAVAPAHAPSAASAAPVGPYERVSCTFGNGVHGAMPPFGKLSNLNGVLVFEAVSRVVTKASALGSDGSATLQSLGAVERGQYRFEIPLDTIQRLDFQGSVASLYCDDGQFEFEALGNAGPQFKAWLQAQGLEIR